MFFDQVTNFKKIIKMRYNVFVVLAISFIFLKGCTEIYEPEISVEKEYLVVEGRLTDGQGPHLVKLSRTNVFGKDNGMKYETNAVIRIKDSNNNIVHLEEKIAGHYHTPADFSGKIGETYTLHIERADGTLYESEQQKMVAPVNVDSVYADFGTQLFFFESQVGGDIYQREVKGVNLFLDVSRDDGKDIKIRFTSILMLQYLIDRSYATPVFDYCWLKKPVTDFLEADIAKTPNIPGPTHTRIAFIPLDSWNMRFIGFPLIEVEIDGQTRIISYAHPRIIKSIYTLNDDAYTFHYERNKQLSDEGSFFDPISPQLASNINNVNDPDDLVLGFFEVSSVTKASLHIRPKVDKNIIKIDTLDCLEYVPTSGCMLNEVPEWWL